MDTPKTGTPTNRVVIYLPELLDTPFIFLLHSWVSFFGIPIRVPLHRYLDALIAIQCRLGRQAWQAGLAGFGVSDHSPPVFSKPEDTCECSAAAKASMGFIGKFKC